MEEIFIYTDEEKEESELILGELKETLGQSFLENDLPKLREHLHDSIADRDALARRNRKSIRRRCLKNYSRAYPHTDTLPEDTCHREREFP